MSDKKDLRLRDLSTDDLFNFMEFSSRDALIYYGNGWYNTIGGYSGGPWHQRENVRVYRIDDKGNRID